MRVEIDDTMFTDQRWSGNCLGNSSPTLARNLSRYSGGAECNIKVRAEQICKALHLAKSTVLEVQPLLN